MSSLDSGVTPIEREIRRSGLDLEDLTLAVYRSKKTIETRKALADSFFSQVQNTPEYLDYSRADQMLHVYKQFTEYVQWKEKNVDKSLEQDYWSVPQLFNHQEPLGIHNIMCVPMVELLCSPEQLSKYIPAIKSYNMIMAYVQTEIGHGSDIQSLETEAVFDPKTQEFVIHTPSTKAIKFWPGELSIQANWIVLYAKLISNGKSCGVLPFLIRIRDQENHRPLRGVEIGDIGPKLNFNTKDNGFIRFHHFRVPKDALFGKFYDVSPDGQFTKKGNEKILYSGMMSMRSALNVVAIRMLSSSVAIATRYSVVRTQFKNEKGVERPLADYQLQQAKLVPQLANLWALRMAQIVLDNLLANHKQLVTKEDFSLMGDVHCALSGLKACSTQWLVSGSEVLRQSCGGQGFMHYSGLPFIVLDHASMKTVEGDNTILLLQVARYLLKNVQAAFQGKPLGVCCEYFKEAMSLGDYSPKLDSPLQCLKLDELSRVFMVTVFQAAKRAGEKLMSDASAKSISMKEAWDTKTGLLLTEIGKLHSVFFILQAFIKELTISKRTPSNQAVLEKLCAFFALHHIQNNSVLFLESEIISPSQFVCIREAYQNLLADLRPALVPLSEAFLPDNRVMMSAIADPNCKPYENLYDWVRKYSSMNRVDMTDYVRVNLNPKL